MSTYAAGRRAQRQAPAPTSDRAVDEAELDALTSRRLRVALTLTAAMLVVYFGFILLIAFSPGFLGKRLVEGLSVGMALGVAVIVVTWILTWVYVRWANRVYEPAVRDLGGER